MRYSTIRRLAFATLLSLATAPVIAQTTTTQLNGGAASIILPPNAEKMDQDTLGTMAPTIMGFALARRLAEQPTTAPALMAAMTALGAAVMSGEGWMTKGETKDGAFFVADLPIPPDFAASDLPLRCPAKFPAPVGATGQAACRGIGNGPLQGLEITMTQAGRPKAVVRLFARSGRLYELYYAPATSAASSGDAAARRGLESLRVK